MSAPTFDPSKYLKRLGGKGGPTEYLEVKWRVVWFRTEHPDGQITTEPVRIDDALAVFKATVSYVHDSGRMVVGTGHGSETPNDFRDYIEKAETKAIGRALAALGYGTPFALDFEEAPTLTPAADRPHVADSPVARPPRAAAPAGVAISESEAADWLAKLDEVRSLPEAAQLVNTLRTRLGKDHPVTRTAQERLMALRNTGKEGHA